MVRIDETNAQIFSMEHVTGQQIEQRPGRLTLQKGNPMPSFPKRGYFLFGQTFKPSARMQEQQLWIETATNECHDQAEALAPDGPWKEQPSGDCQSEKK